jgi:hypothetical protein
MNGALVGAIVGAIGAIVVATPVNEPLFTLNSSSSEPFLKTQIKANIMLTANKANMIMFTLSCSILYINIKNKLYDLFIT